MVKIIQFPAPQVDPQVLARIEALRAIREGLDELEKLHAKIHKTLEELNESDD